MSSTSIHGCGLENLQPPQFLPPYHRQFYQGLALLFGEMVASGVRTNMTSHDQRSVTKINVGFGRN